MIDEVIGVGNQAESIDPKRAEKVDERQNAKSKETKSKQSASGGDSLNISSTAKQALDKTRLMNIARNLPEIREEKVESAKEQIESGEIFSSETTEKLAKKLDQLL